MGDADEKIRNLETEVVRLRQELMGKECELYKLKHGQFSTCEYNSLLTTEEITRYSRQMLVPDVGIKGQEALKYSKVLIVGTGGLGCPSALYLAAAGVGEIVLVDNDVVELSNLHRQILHGESDLGSPKVVSGSEKLSRINSNIRIIPVSIHVNSSTIMELFKDIKFNVVIDGSDNVATRYLLNDTCVMNKVPLVSGSALQMEGQLTVYNYRGGPCYRCLFPQPPPPETVTSCGDGGVLGPIPGTIGVLQALEAIKIITQQSGVLSGRLLTFDGSDTTFRNIKLRPRNSECAVCGDRPEITALIDYEQFCQARADDKVHNISILLPDENISTNELNVLTNKIIIDVRPKIEYEMCHLPDTINIPLKTIEKGDLRSIQDVINGTNQKILYLICRRGNDSQRALQCLKEKVSEVKFINVKGGLHSYAKNVDPLFPLY